VPSNRRSDRTENRPAINMAERLDHRVLMLAANVEPEGVSR
jgi:hypothetical protein